MKVWRIGSNWGGDDVLPVFLEYKIAFAGLEIQHLLSEVEPGNIVGITKGNSIVAVGRVKDIIPLREMSEELANKYEDVNCLKFDSIELNDLFPQFVFGSYGGQGKQFHRAHNEYHNSILQLYTSINATKMRQKMLEILKYKKQIVLQGPPGTGKTRLAKELANDLLLQQELSDIDINLHIKAGLRIKSAYDQLDYEVADIVGHNIKVINGEGRTGPTSFDRVKSAFSRRVWKSDKIREESDSYSAAIAKYLYNILAHEQVKIIQFHPSYSYEDFVRGIVSVPNPEGSGILYEAQNKILGTMASIALNNYKVSQGLNSAVVRDIQIDNFLELFIDHISELIDEGDTKKYFLTDNVYIFESDDKRFKYKGNNWKAHDNGLNMKYDEIKKLIDINAKTREDVKNALGIEALTRSHATYYQRILEKYYEFVSHNNNIAPVVQQPLKNYVLIIDELNRANLPNVLGELIYALEYRGEEVNTMYKVGSHSSLTLPQNLYIIGTMNTADRSVAHIDYAIRRRFAFIDVEPKDLTEELDTDFQLSLFNEVSLLFSHDTNLSKEFEPRDVQLGHSYFIRQYEKDGSERKPYDFALRLEYEIKPILLEYVRDGILIGEHNGVSVAQYISSLQV